MLTHGVRRVEGRTTSAGHETRNTAVVRSRVISSNPARFCSASVHITPVTSKHAIQNTHVTFGDRAIAAAGPGLWKFGANLRDADLLYSWIRQSLKTFLFGQWGHVAVRTILTAPSRNNLTYLLTYMEYIKTRQHICNILVITL